MKRILKLMFGVAVEKCQLYFRIRSTDLSINADGGDIRLYVTVSKPEATTASWTISNASNCHSYL